MTIDYKKIIKRIISHFDFKGLEVDFLHTYSNGILDLLFIPYHQNFATIPFKQKFETVMYSEINKDIEFDHFNILSSKHNCFYLMRITEEV